MKKLIILRGAPGSGKSTLIRNQGLEGFALSPDTLRLLIGGIVMEPEGYIGINQTHDYKVWQEIEIILNKKMAHGEFIIFDATFQHEYDFEMPINLANRHRYEIFCIDFSSLPIEIALEQNIRREYYKQASDDVIRRAYEHFSRVEIPQEIITFPYSNFENASLIDQLDIKSTDLNFYKKIHHIGDLQGCYEPVSEYFAQGLREDEFYIFIGDFLDRGIQNGQVIRWLIDEVMNLPNVVLIWGNHETHIHRYATGQSCISKEFKYNTLPQLEEVNFSKEEANQLCNRLKDCFVYRYGKINCLVSHGGIATVPEHLILIPSYQLWQGTGAYDYSIDKAFSINMAETNWIQVHGHRNPKLLPIKAGAKSYNLEGKVEFGGYLRIMTLNKEGVTEEIQIRNNVYRKEKH